MLSLKCLASKQQPIHETLYAYISKGHIYAIHALSSKRKRGRKKGRKRESNEVVQIKRGALLRMVS